MDGAVQATILNYSFPVERSPEVYHTLCQDTYLHLQRAKLYYLKIKFYFVSRYRDLQLQVGENDSYLLARLLI